LGFYTNYGKIMNITYTIKQKIKADDFIDILNRSSLEEGCKIILLSAPHPVEYYPMSGFQR